MTKEEARLSVMGAISMALKDPILQQGFEIICKELEQKQKEIAELEQQIEKMKCCENCGKEFTKNCAWWKRAEENRQINTCKDWEIKEND